MNALHPHRLCEWRELPETGSKAFTLHGPQGAEEIFLVRMGDNVHAYRNQCPHTGGPLDWVPDQFLDLDKRYIQCATHDARFRIDDGYCVAGPCAGQSLQSLPVEIRGGEVFVKA